MMVRAYTYIREMGAEGLQAATDMAVLNANYLAALLAITAPSPTTAPACTKWCSPTPSSKSRRA